MAQVKIEVSPEYLSGGRVVVDVTVSIPTELLCISSEITVLGEDLHPNWGYWGGITEQSGTPFRYITKTLEPDEIQEIIENIKEYASEARAKQASLNTNSKTYILEL